MLNNITTAPLSEETIRDMTMRAQVQYVKQLARLKRYRENNKEHIKEKYRENIEYYKNYNKAYYYMKKYGMTEEEFKARKNEIEKQKEALKDNLVELNKKRVTAKCC
jgi:transposase